MKEHNEERAASDFPDDGHGAGRDLAVRLTDGFDASADDFESLRRFQALEPGYYWTAQKAWNDKVSEGDTLLLMEVADFEDSAHSVTLRMHPRFGEGSFGMLVQDFLDTFLPCADADPIRQREQQEVMAEVAELQDTLMRTQLDPQLLNEAVRSRVEAGLAELEREEAAAEKREMASNAERAQDIGKIHRRAARRSAANGNPLVAPRIALASEVGSLIDSGINEQGVSELKRMASRQSVVAQAQADWLQAHTKTISRTLERLKPYISERSAVALARASGAVKMAERIRRGIESLDLYTGKNVEVFDIKTGAEAAFSVPLSIIQGKRYAEEELAAWADVDAAFDFRDKRQFFDALASNQSLLDQVLPTPRCVVSIAMTRHARRYDDALTSMVYNEQNLLVFLLVRNGDNVHVVYSGSPSHEGAWRLFPTKNDLEAPFRGMDGERISIRDVEFGERTKQFDNMSLVYRRFLILLCGLDHRLSLFGRFYPPEQQMRFMSEEFQANYFSFVPDEDRDWLIGEELPSLTRWFEEKNRMLQSGSRVFILNGGGVHGACPEIKRRTNLRPTPDQFDAPFTAFREAGELVVAIKAFDRWAERSSESVKCFLTGRVENAAHEDAWWLCVDGVSVDEIRRYRHSRIYRAMGVSYLRLFRRIEAYLDQEKQAEQASRDYLVRNAVEFGGLTAAQAQASIGTAVRNWRASRRGAPLPEVDDKANLNDVLSLMVPEGHLTPQVETMLAAYLESAGIQPLLLTRSGKAKLMLYVAVSAEERAVYPNILTWGWVKRITLEPGKTKLKVTASTLVWLGKVLPASEVQVRRWDGLEQWLNKDEEPISLRKYGAVLPLLEGSKEWEATLRAGPGVGISDDLFEKVYHEALTLNVRNRSKYAIDVIVAIPVAAYSDDGRVLKIAYLRAYASSVMCTYGTPEQRAKVISRFSRSVSQKEKIRTAPQWELVVSSDDKFIAHDKPPGESIPGGKWHPKWARHSVEVNAKRRTDFFPGRKAKGSGTPSTSSQTVGMSLDRAFAHLSGVAPVFMQRAFYKDCEKRAQEIGRWGYARHEGETDDERDARQKRERAEHRAKRYEHSIKAALSPLIWPAGRDRPVANALFSAPLLALARKESDSE